MSTRHKATIPLDIRMLGPMRIALNGETRPLSSRKGQWLLALLALRSGREVARDWLAATLWPDNEETQALFNLRQCLPHVRKALGAEAHRLSSPTPRTLCLDLEGALTDVDAFDAAIQEGEREGAALSALERAVALYRGPLLEGCGEEWILPERRAREEAFLQALETLGRQALEQARPSVAIGYLRRLLAVDPYRESVYGALMQALAEAGDFAAVTRTYRELRLLLRDQLQAAPSAEIQALFERLRLQGKSETSGDASAPLSRPTVESAPSSPDFPAAQPPNNLPRQFTSFIGRASERSGIQRQLTSDSLITLVGPGGTGKTRLSLQIASDLLKEFPDGAWFVEFAPLSDPALTTQAVAEVLGVQEEQNRPLLETLTDTLKSKRLLLVLDNCEHLLEACAQLAAALLRACPQIFLLASSREALHITGETVYRVPPLSLPSKTKPPAGALERAQVSDAVRLFVERADRVRPPFALSEGNAEAIVRICRRLDGIPLALELAAARTNALTPEQIAQRLDNRFHLLTGGRRDVLPRHRTLEALIDWSYDLLGEEEKLLFQRLAVFSGGWTLEAAEAVCADPGKSKAFEPQRHRDTEEAQRRASGEKMGESGKEVSLPSSLFPLLLIEEWEAADLLTALVEKSLAIFEVMENGEGRYRLLETIRAYALRKLQDAGEWEGLQARHCRYYAVLAETMKSKFHGPEQVDCLAVLEREHENLRQALNYCEVTPGLAMLGLRLAAALQGFWWMRGPLSEGKAYYAVLLGHPETQALTPERADALFGAGGVASLQGDHSQGRFLWEECRAIRQQLGDRGGVARALSNLAMAAKDLGDVVEAQRLYQECLSVLTELGDKQGRAFALAGLGQLAANTYDYLTARERYTESLALHREVGNTRGIAVCLGDLGAIARILGDYAAAQALLSEGLVLQRELGNRTGIAILLFYQAMTSTDLKDFTQAHAQFAECLALQQELGNRVDLAATLEAFAALAYREGDPARAARFWGAAETLREVIGSALPIAEQEGYRSEVDSARSAMGDSAFALAWAQGR